MRLEVNPYGLIPMRKLCLVIDVFLVNKEFFSCFSCQLNISCPDICQMSSGPVALSPRMDSQGKASPLTARRDQGTQKKDKQCIGLSNCILLGLRPYLPGEHISFK